MANTNVTMRIDENGNRVCYDRVGNELYDGEKTYQHTRYDNIFYYGG